MKRIGVISDTHGKLPDAAFEVLYGAWSDEQLNSSIYEQADVIYEDGNAVLEANVTPKRIQSQRCDLIIHAGDIGPQSVLDELGAIARTVAVLGNNDFLMYQCSDGAVRDFRSLTFEGIDIFVQHIPQMMEASLRGRPPLQPKRVSHEPELSIHGHTHVPRLDAIGKRVILCPGSPSRARSGSGHSLALVDIEDEKLERISFVKLP